MGLVTKKSHLSEEGIGKSSSADQKPNVALGQIVAPHERLEHRCLIQKD